MAYIAKKEKTLISSLHYDDGIDADTANCHKPDLIGFYSQSLGYHSQKRWCYLQKSKISDLI